jgi:hypothetical protein
MSSSEKFVYRPLRVRLTMAFGLSLLGLATGGIVSALSANVVFLALDALAVVSFVTVVTLCCLRLRLEITDATVVIKNLWRSRTLSWPDVRGIEPGPVKLGAGNDACLHFRTQNDDVPSLVTFWPGRHGAELITALHQHHVGPLLVPGLHGPERPRPWSRASGQWRIDSPNSRTTPR